MVAALVRKPKKDDLLAIGDIFIASVN